MDLHSYNTRGSLNFHLPQIRTTVAKNSIFFKGPTIWNNLPIHIKSSPSLNIFKRRYKSLLINRYNT